METREYLNTAEGFERIIDREDSIIKEKFDNIEQCEKAQKEGKQLFSNDNLTVIILSRQSIVTHYFSLIFAKYSAGITINEIKNDYLIALDVMEKVWMDKSLDDFSNDNSEPFYSTDEFWKIMQIIALGILLNITEKEKKQIINIRDKVATPDFILDFLCSYFDNRNYGDEQSTGDKFNGLISALQESSVDNATSIMKTYLKRQWLKDYKRQGQVITHNSKYNIHSGYWSFETGAIMKILKVDDSILKGQQFYPYDMVHWQ